MPRDDDSSSYSHSTESDDEVIRPAVTEEASKLFRAPTASFENELSSLANILSNVGSNFDKIQALGQVRGHA